MAASSAGEASPRLPVRHDWLATHVEDALLPELPIVDAHHHLWDLPGHRYLLPDLVRDLASGHRVVATVFVQSHLGYRTGEDVDLAPVGETDHVRAICDAVVPDNASGTRVAAGIVGAASLSSGAAVARVLDAHIEAGAGRFRGVRELVHWHADPAASGPGNTREGLLSDAAFRAGFACLAPRGLSFDAWVYHTQLHELTGLARAFPSTTIIVNHCGGPIGIGPYASRRDEVFAAWSGRMAELANCANVYVKLGGLGMRLFGARFHEQPVAPGSKQLADAWSSYIETCIAAFGPERCMFESNAPVDKGTCSYVVAWNAFKRIALRYTEAERNALCHGTAARVYDVPLPAYAQPR